MKNYKGTKLRAIRLNDENYEKVLHIVKANDCDTLRDFLEAIASQELIILKNFSKSP